MTRPGWRLWLSLLVACFAMSAAGVTISVRVAERNTEERIKVAQVAAEKSKRVTCELAGSMLDGYEAEPPSTDTGRIIVTKWLEQYRILGCSPTR